MSSVLDMLRLHFLCYIQLEIAPKGISASATTLLVLPLLPLTSPDLTRPLHNCRAIYLK